MLIKHYGALTNNANFPKSIALQAHHYIRNNTDNLPTQNNKSVKVPFTRDVQKNTALGVWSRDKYVQHKAS